MAFVLWGKTPLAILEESHRCHPPPLDGSVAEGMAVPWLLAAISQWQALLPVNGDRLTLAKPAQSLRARGSGTHRDFGRGCVSL